MHLRDRIVSFCGLGLLAVLVAATGYYAVRSNFLVTSVTPNQESPDFASRDCVVTTFEADGTPKYRIYAEYVEHYTDGRSVSIKPKLVTLSPDKPQLKMSANTGSTLDEGETVVFTGNIVLTRAGDRENAPLRLTTSHAIVNPDTQVVTSNAPVRIEHGGDVSTGIGFDYDNVDRIVHLDSDVHTFIMPRNSR